MQFQPCQLSPEVSRTSYREIEAHLTKGGRIAVGIAERKCAAFCHALSLGLAASSCDLLSYWVSPRGGSIQASTAFDYAISELLNGVGRSRTSSSRVQQRHSLEATRD